MRTLFAAIAVLVMSAAGLVLTGTAAQAVDYDCSDFGTQAAAQHYLLPGDPYGLDRDGDGTACDSLPCPCSSSQPTKPAPVVHKVRPIVQYGNVVRVIDGDTVDVRIAGHVRRVRLLGINTPELHPRQCYATQAKTAARRQMPVGSRVKLTSDVRQPRTDRYGRQLRYVSRGKTDVNRRLVYAGAARVFVVGRPFSRVSSYRQAQAAANRAHRGLWRACR